MLRRHFYTVCPIMHSSGSWGERVARAAGIIVLGVCLSFAVACTNTPTSEQCDALLDHVIDLQSREGGADKDLAPEIKRAVEGQKQKLAAHLRDNFLSGCQEDLTKEFVDCGLRARSTEQYAQCEEGPK